MYPLSRPHAPHHPVQGPKYFTALLKVPFMALISFYIMAKIEL